ncbi:MAG: UDP-N-acetylglucosamine--N-acetylmuramyl-(pentapeptide) pyrophosphoryl-undecaprenol N-acetylglucosamine transferase [Actinomycetia bacterium]|nr:UDP-N-acetylglucosamine--N-acetylmuramyl-(pentapeptide) pyrophosphoryl-undecaprenol N-acetylglucosamine transferase [Actinomycetes bacterium]
MTIGIAAAGSGGHVYPALAVAEELVDRGISRDRFVFFGGDRMEASVVPEAGFPFVAVDIHGIRRSISFDNVRLPMKIRSARTVIADAIEANGIAVMVVFGGYVAGPAALAAKRSKIPLIVHEANAVPGIANRLIAGRADTVYTAFAPAQKKLRTATTIGSPLRSSFEKFDRITMRESARERLGVTTPGPVLVVVGGSLGAAALNDIAASLALADGRSYTIVHVCGPTHGDRFTEESRDVPGWIVKGFEDDMPMLYAAADLVLARGGAMTIAELHATQTPAVIVPLPAGGGYQTLNAADAVGLGGMVAIDQNHTEEIMATVDRLITDADGLTAMSAALVDAPHLEAARIVADRALEVLDG